MKQLFTCMIILLMFSNLACNQPDNNTDKQPGSDTTDGQIIDPDNETSTDVEQLNEFNENGISFKYSSLIAAEASLTNVKGDPDCDFLPYPDYLAITFHDYIHSEAFTTPALMLFSVDEYYSILDYAATQVDTLKTINASPTVFEDAEDLPFLPVWNAAQHFHSNVKFITFNNGSGLRYLTQYVQDISPVYNEALFYTFQGITDDGAVYIAMTMPVTHPDLPDLWEDFFDSSDDNIKAYGESYETYLKETVKMLDATSDEIFIPSLQMLDDIIKSLTVE